ncbi:MAG: ATPase, T2SS/T4P/T4SS family [Candidatus Woesearchaeota archaeon]|nr:ATPase, T2SS/T4P/T4SS family [Candidatus Woesearchaeota archaeon]
MTTKEAFKTSATELLRTDTGKEQQLLDSYSLETNNIVIDIRIITIEEEAVPIYNVSIANISPTTRIILEKIRQEFVSKMNIEDIQSFETADNLALIKQEFRKEIRLLINKYFPKTDEKTINMLVNYLLEENLGLGKIDILLSDSRLEEIIINSHAEPVWVYHRRLGWLKTNIVIPTEARIRHFATIIGRDIGKEITNLNPLMDAHLVSGDRVNATLMPISNRGNTITIRKFAEDPWTITKFIDLGTTNTEAAALIWLAMQNELSILIAGGTGSGKTSMLNVVCNFFPPNQRIVSIEDTRELILPGNLHWVPMETRLPNPEGKGGVSMLDLLVNSLRMRPDRILVGEIRRKQEAEVLLEAMHTGHSVYATIHANDAEETVRRLTNPPIDIPKPMISSISLIVVQNRNRRNGKRRTFQIAEVTETGDAHVLLRYNPRNDKIERIAESKVVYEHISLYTGMDRADIEKDIQEKVKILDWLVEKKIEDVDDIGMQMARYYMSKVKR